MDNLLIQVTGQKKIRLWAPNEEPNLYVKGSSSEVIDIDHPDPIQFPKFSKTRWIEITLNPGQMLFIPALWFHNVRSESFSVSINVFFHHLDPNGHDRKDLYGNRDPIVVQKANRLANDIVECLAALPDDFKKFYGRRIAATLEAAIGLNFNESF